MHRKQLAVTGVLTVAASGLVAIGLALSSGQGTEPNPDTTPAGQVEEIAESTTPTTSTTTTPTQVPQDDATPADNGPVNTPANEPAEQAPPPGVPYDSDGGTVVPNPPDLGPGELAPRPPTQNPPGPPQPPVEPPIIPGEQPTPSGD